MAVYFRFSRVTKTQETISIQLHKSDLGLLFMKPFSKFLPPEKLRDKQDSLEAKGTDRMAKSEME